jgi:hypothetical protein
MKPIIHMVKDKATAEQIQEMAAYYAGHIKVAVDLEQYILAGGGEWHADCERVLLKQGSIRENVWGGGYHTETDQVDFYSLINIRPQAGNSSQEVLDAGVRQKIEQVIRERLA